MTDKEKSAFDLLEIAHNLQVDNVNMSGEDADVLYNLIKKQESEIERLTKEVKELHPLSFKKYNSFDVYE